MNRAEKIKANPNIKQIADELDRVAAISALADIQGGKLLIQNLLKAIGGSVDTLCYKYKTLTLQEFVGLCADMNTKLDLVRTIKKSGKAKKIAMEDLENALLEVEE